jgi:hypothetical protein
LERRVYVWKPIDTCQKNLDYHRKGWFITVLFHWHITWVYERFDCFITILILLRAILMISHVFWSFRVPYLWYHMGVWMIQLVYYSFGSLSSHTYDITWVCEWFSWSITVLVLSRAMLMISHGCVNDSVGLLQFWSFRVPCLWYHMGVWMIQLVYYSFGPFACHTYDITWVCEWFSWSITVLVLSRAMLMISHGCVNDSVGLLQFWFFVVPNDTSIFVFIVNVFLWLCNSYLTNGPSRIVLYLHCVWDILNVISLKDT